MKKYVSPFKDFLNDTKNPEAEKPKPVKGTRVRFELIFDSIRDWELIEYLNKQPNKAEYIRQLIREDIDAM